MRLQVAALLLLIFAVPVSIAADVDTGPRFGKYLIMSYGTPGRPPLQLGHFVLERGKYKAYLPGDRSSGSGEWRYDAAKKSVIWVSGPYAGVWDGKFKAERGGKTHNVSMKRSTFGTNSIE